MSRDVIAELRGQDPARRTHLDAVDPGALVALREGITMTDLRTNETQPAATLRPARQGVRRLGGRGALVGGLAVVLAGGGVAFAATQLWTDEETAATNGMGVECTTLYGQAQGAVAPTLTGDPVADCARVRADAGLEPIEDPVAFIVDAAMWVAPRDQVPAGAKELVVDAPAAAAIRELQASLADVVDGGAAQCLPAEEAAAWAQGELDRLGISGWTVRVGENRSELSGPCSVLSVGDEPQTIAVTPDLDPRVEEWVEEDYLSTLRSIGTQCLTLDEAGAVVEEMFGEQQHFPTTRVPDETASCTRVDMEVGGSYLVTLYGPTVD